MWLMITNDLSGRRCVILSAVIGGILFCLLPLYASDYGLDDPSPYSGINNYSQTLSLALLGGLFGLTGQLARVVVGFKDELTRSASSPKPATNTEPPQNQQQSGQAPPPGPPVGQKGQPPPQVNNPSATDKRKTDWTSWFDPVQFWTSLGLGAAAGMAAAIIMGTPAIDKTFIVACATAGYAGSDFIEGLISPGSSGKKSRGSITA
jgi:hypothetical protein